MYTVDFPSATEFVVDRAFLRRSGTTGTSMLNIALHRLCTNITRRWIVASVRLSGKKIG
jgi:hypothetical protein